jgi:hypothetical protein
MIRSAVGFSVIGLHHLILLIERFVTQIIACVMSFCAYVLLDTAYHVEGSARSKGLLDVAKARPRCIESQLRPPRAVSSLLNRTAHHQRVREKGLPYYPSWTQQPGSGRLHTSRGLRS